MLKKAQDREYIIQLADGTRTYSDIAKILGLTYFQVTSKVEYLRRLGEIVLIKPEATRERDILDYANGSRSFPEIAAILGVEYHALYRRVRRMLNRGIVVPVRATRRPNGQSPRLFRKKRPDNTERNRQIASEVARGDTLKDIADRHKITREGVRKIALRLGQSGPEKRAARLERNRQVLVAIKRGDSLSAIANAFGLSREGVRRIGLRNDVDTVRVQGQKLL